VFMSCFALAILATLGVPGTSGAPGELLILAGAFARSPSVGILAALVPIISAVYGIRVLHTVSSGPATDRGSDLSWRERALLIPLLLLVIAVGVVPVAISDLTPPSGPALTERSR
jgi:NADH-quinone oxidoreductase subunit M